MINYLKRITAPQPYRRPDRTSERAQYRQMAITLVIVVLALAFLAVALAPMVSW